MTPARPPSVTGDAGDALEAEAGRVFDAYLADLEAGRPADPEALLAAHAHLADRLRACLDVMRWADRLADRPEASVGLQLGDFRIVRAIGRGGMGVVYEAEQLSLRRRVALKVLPPGAALDPRHLRRFQVEAHAVASLHHTNIVPIHAVGYDGGVPYFAMQLIEGRSLADVIRELQQGGDRGVSNSAGQDALASSLAKELSSGRFAPAQPAGSPTPDATPTPSSSTHGRRHARTVAGLGLQAAEALEHAHARGVLHRDIKPANLLLDAEGRLWLTDFGLARLPVDQGLTATGDTLGTLRYMSPEQAKAVRVLLDGRTDIYSLGVTLYELLTLRAAIEGNDRQELLRRIAEVEPTPPRRHDQSIPRDLETILLKAMAKDVAQRYATARDLANDLRRFLDDQAVHARRPTLVERAGRWVRRHSALVASTFAGLALAVTILAVSVFLLWREQGKTAAALRSAEEGRREARRAVDTMYTRVAEKWLKNQPQMEGLQREFLEEAQRFYDKFAQQSGADPAVRLETALAAQRAGDIQHKLGLQTHARVSYERAIALLDGLLADSPGSIDDLRVRLSLCWMTLGFVLERQSSHEAEQAHRRAVSLAEELVAKNPSEPRYLYALAQRANNLGNAVMSLGRYDEAENLYRRGGDLSRKLSVQDPHNVLYHYAIGVGHGGVADIQLRMGRWREAETSVRSSIAEYEQIPDDFSTSKSFKLLLALAYRRLALILLGRGDQEGSRDVLQKVVELTRGLAESFPGVPDYRQNLAAGYTALGQHHAAYGRYREAEESFRTALAIQEHLYDGAPDSTERVRVEQGGTEQVLGDVLTANGQPGEARKHYERALEALRILDRKIPNDLALVCQFARFLTTCPDPQLRDPDEALRLAIRATEGAPAVGPFWTTLGLAHYRSNDWPAAQRALEKAIRLCPEDPTAGFVLAMTCWRTGDKLRARDLFEESETLATAKRSHDLEIRRLRAEAASLLDVSPTSRPRR